MPRNSPIPGVAEVPMPPAAPKARKPKPAPVSTPSTPATGEAPKAKATRRPRGSAPKPVRLEPNFGKSGIRIFVGESKIPVATISQETLDEAFNDYGFGPKGHKELRGLRDGLLDCMPKDFHPEITGDVTRIATWVGDLEGKLAVAQSNLKEARDDHEAALRARDYHRELKETAEGDAASYRRSAEEWRKAAARNLDDLNAAKRDLTTLQVNFDALNDEFKAEKRSRHQADESHASALSHAKGMAYLMAGVAVLLLVGMFIVQVPPMSMRGAR